MTFRPLLPKFAILALAASLTWPVMAQDSEWSADFERQFAASLAEEGVPGGSYVIVRNGAIHRVGSYGRARAWQGDPIEADTVFRLASVSKGFAATLATMLSTRGQLQLDAPVQDYAPHFLYPRNGRAILVEDLLGQSTGFVSHAFDNMLNEGETLDRILPHFGDLPPVCVPGSCYTYQNNTFSLIEPVVETATGIDFSHLIRSNLFEPLGMEQASIGQAGLYASTRHAEPHVKRLGNWQTVAVQPNYYHVLAAAGVNASALDMGQWLLALLGHRPDVLETDVLSRMTSPRIRSAREMNRRHWRDLIDDAHYGLGWRVYDIKGHRLIYHGGWVSGFRAVIAFSPEMDVGMAILLNAESNVISELSADFWRPLLLQAPPGGAAPTSAIAHP